MHAKIPIGISLVRRVPGRVSSRTRNRAYRLSVVLLTFCCYTSYHLSRKALSVVKDTWLPKTACQGPDASHNGSDSSATLEMERQFQAFDNTPRPSEYIATVLARDAAQLTGRHDAFNETQTSPGGLFTSSNKCLNLSLAWEPFDSDAKLGYMDVAYALAYALAMFASGHVGDRVSLRYFLFVGMALSGLFTALLGLPQWTHIHSLPYFLCIQALNGLAQSTGWPSVVAVMGNWFGRGNRGRGLVMGIWNAHTSVGNILGSIIPAIWTPEHWGWAFIVPGLIIFGMGLIILTFLAEEPHKVGCDPPQHHTPMNADEVAQSTDYLDEERRPLLYSSSIQGDPRQAFGPVPNDHHLIPRAALPTAPSHALTVWEAMKIPGVFHFSICLFFTKFVFYIFLFWLPVYIRNMSNGHNDIHASNAPRYATLFDVGGIVGGILAGLISDQGETRALTCTAMLFSAIPSLWLFKEYGVDDLGHLLGLVLLVGTMVNGPYCLITTVVSIDLGNHKRLRQSHKAKATVAAIIDGTGSVGAALGLFVTSQGLKYLKSSNSWDVVLYICMGCCFLAALPLLHLCIDEVETLQTKRHSRTIKQPVTVQSAWLT